MENDSDPLYLAPASRDPNLDYQWFRIALAGEPDSSVEWRSRGWQPVPRSSMADEPSTGATYVERREMRLYQRSKEASEAARAAATQKALAEYEVVRALSAGGRSGGRTPGRWFAIKSGEGVPNRSQRDPLRWLEKNARGSVLTIHEEALNRHLAKIAAPLLAACQYRLAPLRVVYLPRGETDMAYHMHMPYAEWAWGKVDAVREGSLPYSKVVVRRRYAIQINCPNWRALAGWFGSTWNRVKRSLKP